MLFRRAEGFRSGSVVFKKLNAEKLLLNHSASRLSYWIVRTNSHRNGHCQ